MSNPPKLLAVACEATCLLMGFGTAKDATERAGDATHWWGISKKKLFLNSSCIRDLTERLSSDEVVPDVVFKRAADVVSELDLQALKGVAKVGWAIGLFCKARIALIEARSGSDVPKGASGAADPSMQDATTTMEEKRQRCARAIDELVALEEAEGVPPVVGRQTP